MAETLGTAELVLSVNDDALRQGLRDARRLIDGLQNDVNRTTTRARRGQSGTGGGTPANNRRETKAERDLEILKEKRFRLARRIDVLEERGVGTSRLRTQLGRLTTAYADREFATARQISRELARQVTLSEAKERSARRAAREARAEANEFVRSPRGLGRVNLDGSRRDIGSPIFSERGFSRGGARESIDALTNAQKRRYNLDQQIRSLEAGGVRTDRLRTQLGEATTAQAQRQFGSFNRIADSLEFTLRKERDRLRVIRDQNREIERQARRGGPSEPIRGRVGLTGSPADLAFLARQGGARSPIGGTRNIPDSPAALRAEERLAAARERSARAAERARLAEDRAAQAEGRRLGRLNASPVRGGIAFPGSPGAIAAAQAEGLRIGSLNTSPVRGGRAFPDSPAANEAIVSRNLKVRTSWAKALDFLEDTAERIAFNAKAAGQAEGLRIGRLNTSQLRGGPSIPGSPAFLDSIFPAFPKDFFAQQKKAQREQDRAAAARSRRRQDITSNALIGGAFPLLFGQGIGASLGGAAGGAAGGALGGQFGFGLSLVGTALGAQFDLAIQKSGDLAKALDDPIGQFSALQQNALLSSKELEKQVEALIAVGRTAEAAVLIQEDLAKIFGNSQGAKDYVKATDDLNRAWTEASVTLAGFVAGPLAEFLRFLSVGLNASNAAERVRGQRSGLTADQNKQVSEFRNRRSRELGLGDFATDREALQLNLDTLKEIDRITGQTAKSQSLIGAIRQQEQRSLSLSYRLIDASTQGYTRQTLELQKQQVIQDRNRELLSLTEKERNDPANAKVIDINQKAAKAEYDLKQQIAQLDAERAAQSQLDAAQNAIKAQSIAEQVRNTQALAAAEKGVERQTLATIQAVQSGVAEARRREQSLGAQIDAARLRGGDAGEIEAARLVGEQRIAANETRLALEEGRKALIEGSEVLLENIRTGVLEFTRIRSDPQGLNRFLNSQEIQQRAERDFQTLLPSFREAQGRFTQLTGARAPEFTGSTSGVNESIRNFIESVSREFDSTKDLNATYAAANKINSELVSVNARLAQVTQTLADKNWLVNVAVAGGQAAAYGDVLNGALSA